MDISKMISGHAHIYAITGECIYCGLRQFKDSGKTDYGQSAISLKRAEQVKPCIKCQGPIGRIQPVGRVPTVCPNCALQAHRDRQKAYSIRYRAANLEKRRKQCRLYAQRMRLKAKLLRPKEISCQLCKAKVLVTNRLGPIPRYCPSCALDRHREGSTFATAVRRTIRLVQSKGISLEVIHRTLKNLLHD